MDDVHKRFRLRKRRMPNSVVPAGLENPRTPEAAADMAEVWLLRYGVPGKSSVEVFFNGDDKAHSIYYLSGPEEFTVFNTTQCRWPVEYPEGYGTNAEGALWDLPDPDAKSDENSEDEAEKGKHKKDDDADSMDLGAEDDDTEQGYEDEENEGADDDNSENESESDGDEDDSDEENEMELPRLTVFAKMRGVTGWRKRSEAESENTINKFAWRIGVLQGEEGDRPSYREKNIRLEVEFIERDDKREAGTLRLRVPEGVEFIQAGRWITAQIPYKDED